MTPERSPFDIEEMMKDSRYLEAAFLAAAKKVRRLHRALGIPLVIMQDGRVVHIPPDEITDID